MRTFGSLLVSAVLLASALVPGSASAVQSVSSCNTTCTQDCELSGSLNCSNGQGITLQSGYDVDLKGYELHCTAGSCYSKPAVAMSANGSVVKDTVGGGKISGPFYIGVQCNQKTDSEVNGITFSGIDTYGAIGCGIVEHNVFLDAAVHNVYLLGTSTTNDRVRHNYINVPGNTGVTVATNDAASVDHNVFMIEENLAYSSIGVEIGGTGATVTDNIFIGEYGTPITGTAVTAARNYCDVSGSGCQSCLSGGNCTDPTSPFTMP